MRRLHVGVQCIYPLLKWDMCTVAGSSIDTNWLGSSDTYKIYLSMNEWNVLSYLYRLSDPDYCTPRSHFEDDFWSKLDQSHVPSTTTIKPPTPSTWTSIMNSEFEKSAEINFLNV